MSRVAIYPGSFDPPTCGHVGIIERGVRLFDRVIVAVATNPGKNPLFTIDERIEMMRDLFDGNPAVAVATFDGLLVDAARRFGACAILRGLRAVSDFEYEYQMASMNRRLAGDVETVFLMAAPDEFFVSSRLVKEVASLGGSITGVVPTPVEKRILERMQKPPLKSP